MVVLFSVDCPDCRHELPEVQKLWDRSRQGELTGDGKPLPIVLIARKNLAEDIEPFWKFSEFTMPYSPQPDRKVYRVSLPRASLAFTSAMPAPPSVWPMPIPACPPLRPSRKKYPV